MDFKNWNHRLPEFWNHPSFPTESMQVGAFGDFLGSVESELHSIHFACSDSVLIDVSSIKTFIRCLPIVGLHDYVVTVIEGVLTLFHCFDGTRVAYYFGDEVVGYKLSKRADINVKPYHVGKFYPAAEANIPDVVRTFVKEHTK